MVCADMAPSRFEIPLGDNDWESETSPAQGWFGDFLRHEVAPLSADERADGKDPFDDFEDDDFDDEFDDDFEEDWEDDLTEDDEFPDTFGGADPEEEKEIVEPEESPFADDPDFDDA